MIQFTGQSGWTSLPRVSLPHSQANFAKGDIELSYRMDSQHDPVGIEVLRGDLSRHAGREVLPALFQYIQRTVENPQETLPRGWKFAAQPEREKVSKIPHGFGQIPEIGRVATRVRLFEEATNAFIDASVHLGQRSGALTVGKTQRGLTESLTTRILPDQGVLTDSLLFYFDAQSSAFQIFLQKLSEQYGLNLDSTVLHDGLLITAAELFFKAQFPGLESELGYLGSPTQTKKSETGQGLELVQVKLGDKESRAEDAASEQSLVELTRRQFGMANHYQLLLRRPQDDPSSLMGVSEKLLRLGLLEATGLAI